MATGKLHFSFVQMSFSRQVLFPLCTHPQSWPYLQWDSKENHAIFHHGDSVRSLSAWHVDHRVQRPRLSGHVFAADAQERESRLPVPLLGQQQVGGVALSVERLSRGGRLLRAPRGRGRALLLRVQALRPRPLPPRRPLAHPRLQPRLLRVERPRRPRAGHRGQRRGPGRPLLPLPRRPERPTTAGPSSTTSSTTSSHVHNPSNACCAP